MNGKDVVRAGRTVALGIAALVGCARSPIPYSTYPDLDADGIVDHFSISASQRGDVTMYDFAVARGTGNGTFEYPTQIHAMVMPPINPSFRDITGDGRLDLVYTLKTAEGCVRVYFANESDRGEIKFGESHRRFTETQDCR